MYMTQALHRSMQQRPDKVAVRFNGRALTYAEIGDRVARLAGALRKLGVAEGERVAMFSLNSARYIEYYMAVPWAGAVLNPVNFRWSAAEIAYSFKDSGTAVLIVDDPFTEVAQKVAAECTTVRHVIYAGDGETPAGMLNYETLIADSAPMEDAYRHGDDLAGIFYTGGTTGFPKGVMLSHANLISSACNQPMSGTVDESIVMMHVMPMFHLACFASINAVFLVGGTHVAISAFDPGRMMEGIAQDRVTAVLLAPTMIQMGLDWMDRHPGRAAELDLSSLNSLRYGASPMTPALLERTRQTFPAVRFSQGYGMTELAPVATMLGPEYHDAAAQASGKMYSVGRPAHTVEVKVVDSRGNEVPRGTVGEIIVRGPNVMLGYWNQPQATAEAIRNGWMHTGDGGYMDKDGFLFLVDRLKDMIISGGENVYSAEVEKALASHPAVAQSSVIGVPHEKWGESVHAVVVLRQGESATLESIQSHCRERIAGYKIPRSVEFVDALPLSSVGKVLKNELRKRHWK
ncbi:acyl-CoA synthetase (AMP-forming)/AMP-acid ligase II [Cupriavidus metallidurans]|jgi:long-chain acyl-CoA synthetase|uniref:AMP-dependent synthetase and ligase n=1 Tax=Cupriavidus metallidurans (strain ATCC 43123 / DSM 2839 / NBRC 102507 / CH34) TaxID=266264 RepID=Q1LKC4_CUPMC|nr:long-chain-fatty-acid--CoA ligase [Cupriavidus metallidurans]ABF09402.1 AMP-dependent synthetase and ligase [Cupriavidus metallidurans CH34]AVA36585.1 fatty-acid--CoA ligase [Cupriavidus metallidurans]KWW37416.1 Long-chain-fatty-acid--CoA ligase [Cupriavidus metallidurans]MDE4918927.1 long-chain-fatty-acid--CoA ligase [Cupriavidus metallidurans]QGS29736.1 long-chain-fatty-acid--CoA ligase [Cupriavidus metallidurans]